jgi:hypothetical protein
MRAKNTKLQERTDNKDWKLGIKLEYTAHETPQHNHLAKLVFAILANRCRAMLHKAYIPKLVRYKLWRECFKTSTLLDGLMVVSVNDSFVTRYKHWCNDLPHFHKYLRTWGEAGTEKVKTKMTPKL